MTIRRVLVDQGLSDAAPLPARLTPAPLKTQLANQLHCNHAAMHTQRLISSKKTDLKKKISLGSRKDLQLESFLFPLLSPI